MKFKILFYFFIIIITAISCSPSLEKKIIGEWQGKMSNGHEVSLIFKDKNIFLGIFGNESIKGDYYVDFSSKPIKLDIDIGEKDKALTIIEFIDDDKMKFQKAEFQRPTEFTDPVILYKTHK